MSADHVAVLAAAAAAGAVALVLLVAVVVLGRRVKDLGHLVEELRHETVPLVREARVVVDQAATEMVRVGDVLESAEAVSATVDSASRLAYRAFSNPVVKVLAYGTGVGSAVGRFFGRGGERPVRKVVPLQVERAPKHLARGDGAPNGARPVAGALNGETATPASRPGGAHGPVSRTRRGRVGARR